MADETKYRRGERLFRICGIGLVVLLVTALVYLAPVAFLARINGPSGLNKYLSISAARVPHGHFAESQTEEEKRISKEKGYHVIYAFTHPILDRIYSPLCDAAGGFENEQNKFSKFILGVD